MRTLLTDIRYAVRTLVKAPVFAAVAIVVLALGIGLNTAIFSLVNALILRPLPGDSQPGQVVGLYSYNTTRPNKYREFSYPLYTEIRDRNRSFTDLTAYTVVFVGIGERELTRGQLAFMVTSNFFRTFGVQPARGRGFLGDEERPGAAKMVVILSDEYWRKLGADPNIVGRTIRLNTRSFVVVGVMPRGFGGPTTLITPAVWLPTGVYDLLRQGNGTQSQHTLLGDPENYTLLVAGRLKPGLTLAAAEPEVKRFGGRLRESLPGVFRDQGLQAHMLSRTDISTEPRDSNDAITPGSLLMAMAAVVLLIACMNLANMMLARGAARRREMAICMSLGARRGRVVRQLVTEGFVLSLAGGVAGLLLTYWGLRFFSASIDPMLPMLILVEPRPDARVLGVTLAFSVVATLTFALGPALRLTNPSVIADIKEGDSAGARRKVARFGLRHVLVVAQVALSLALLTAAGLFARGAFNVSQAEPGFSFDGGVVVSVDPSLAGIDQARGRDFYRRVGERVRALPGVEAATFASVVPFGDFTEGARVRRVGEPGSEGRRDDMGGSYSSYGAGDSTPRDNQDGIGTTLYTVGRDYFRTLGIPILRGRGFSELEEQSETGPRVAIIDQTLARKLFKRDDPLGEHIYFPDPEPSARRPYEVVAIVGGSRHGLFDKEPTSHVYLPFGQHYRSMMHLQVRLASHRDGSDGAMLQLLRREIRAVDDRVPLLALKTLREHRDSSMGAWMVRTGARLFTLFGIVAVLLALVGVYGVRAYLVSRRTREIGIRIALGATGFNVLWLVLREGLLLVVIGLAVGLGFALATGKLVASLLYDVRAFDPLVFSVAPLLLALSAIVACYFPARRAMKIAPVIALRSE